MQSAFSVATQIEVDFAQCGPIKKTVDKRDGK